VQTLLSGARLQEAVVTSGAETEQSLGDLMIMMTTTTVV
jgi:hypothetical protein